MRTNLLLKSTFALFAASLFPLQAADVTIENDYFIVTLKNADTWNNIGSQSAGLAEVTAEVNNVLDYWSSLFADGHRPVDADNRVTVELSFKDLGNKNIIGNSSPEIMWFNNENPDGTTNYFPFTLDSGAGYNALSAAEAKLLHGYTGTLAGSADLADITINFNSIFDFYFGETAGLTSTVTDFNTILLHEMAHGIGFMGLQFIATETPAPDPNPDDGITPSPIIEISPLGPTTIDPETKKEVPIYVDGKLVTYITPWSGLMELDPDNYAPGQQITLAGVEGSEVFNPSPWRSGSSLTHITEGSDPNAVMNFAIGKGVHFREFSEMELEIYAAMGWNFGFLIPEPSTATLSLIALAGLLARRRRVAK